MVLLLCARHWSGCSGYKKLKASSVPPRRAPDPAEETEVFGTGRRYLELSAWFGFELAER